MPEPQKNGQAANPDHVVHENHEINTRPTGSVDLKFYSQQGKYTLGDIQAWGINLQALEVTLEMAYRTVYKQRTGIDLPPHAAIQTK